MKSRTMIFIVLICVGVLFFSHRYTSAQPSEPVLNIGIINMERALSECQATAKFREQTIAENSAANTEQTKLSQEIQALTAILKSGAIKAGSDDYMAQYKELIHKQADLDFLQEVYPQQRTLKYQQWTQELYRRILQITNELAEEKGLPLVLVTEEPEFPVESYDELMTALATHKVLYSGGCLDITGEVINRLDAEESQPEN